MPDLTPSPADQGERILAALREARARLAAAERARTEPIAIIGASCRFPGGADSLDKYWELLRDGRDAVAEIPADRLDLAAWHDANPHAKGKVVTRFGALLADVDQFDAEFFDISPREAASLDPQQRLLLEVAWEALESAGQAPDRLGGSRTGVFVGLGQCDYALLQLQHRPASELDVYVATGSGLCYGPGRLAHHLGLRGPNLTVDTACSSSLVAVHLACQSLRSGECDLALAGGVHLALSPLPWVMLSASGALAPGGRCRPFDAAAEGFGRGEGCGVVALRTLSAALANRDPILAVVRGSAVNHAGVSSGLTVPSESSQEELLRMALAAARLQPSDVDYVEAHGTGTLLGDPIEAAALGSIFATGRKRPLWIGSVKSNLGHLEAAAGVAGLLKVVLMLMHGQIAPQLHFAVPNPRIAWPKLPLAVPTQCTAWPRCERPRIAGVSSFGMSGASAHVVVEEGPLPTAPLSSPKLQLLTLSARSEEALSQLAGRYAVHLSADDQADLADIALTLNTGRAQFPVRTSLVADSTAAARQALEEVAAGRTKPSRVAADGSSALQQKSLLASLSDPQHDRREILSSLGELYEHGVAIDWNAMHGDLPRRVRLPTYPFQRQRHWFENEAPAVDVAADKDWWYEVRWSKLPESAPRWSSAPAGTRLIFADRAGLAAQLRQRFQSAGDAVVLVLPGEHLARTAPDQWVVNPERRQGFDALLQECAPLASVSYLWSCDDPLTDNVTADDLDRQLSLGLGGALRLVQALERHQANQAIERLLPLWFVTRSAVSVARDEPAAGLSQSPLWGFGKVVSLEFPHMWGGLVDLPATPDSRDLDVLFQQVRASHDEDHVAIRCGERWAPRLTRIDPSERVPVRLRADVTYLITGGLGGLGRQVAEMMLARGARYLVLLSRRQPDESATNWLQRMNRDGVAVIAAQGDVASHEDVRRAVSQINRSPAPLAGVIHAAGLLGHCPLVDLDWAATQAVLRPKVRGTWVLDQETRQADLDFFVTFSSVAAVWGSQGQSHYAAANAFQDAWAQWRRACGLPGTSISWGPWLGEGMATDEGRQWLSQSGVRSLPVADALRALSVCLDGRQGHLAIADVDWETFHPIYTARRSRPLIAEFSQGKPRMVGLEDSTHPTSFDSDLPRPWQDLVHDHVRAVLKWSAGQSLDPNAGFVKLGMDSLMAVELSRRLAQELGCTVPSTVAFEFPTVKRLADCLSKELAGEGDASQEVPGDEPAELPLDDGRKSALSEKLSRLEALLGGAP